MVYYKAWARERVKHQLAMDYRPAHIITNNPEVFYRAANYYRVEIKHASRDYTAEEGEHFHYLVHWPKRTRESGRQEYKPTKTTFVRGARRLISPRCDHCYHKSFNTVCPVCGTYFKINWCKDNQHAVNTFYYIDRKLEERPEWKIPGSR